MNKEKFEERLEKHGELHIVVEEHESVMAGSEEEYIGIRNGEHYNLLEDEIEIVDGSTHHYIPYDRIVYINTPVDFPD